MSFINGGVHTPTIQRAKEAIRADSDGGTAITEQEFRDIATSFMTRGFFDTNTQSKLRELDPELDAALDAIKAKVPGKNYKTLLDLGWATYSNK